jgi:hypothetical protein
VLDGFEENGPLSPSAFVRMAIEHEAHVRSRARLEMHVRE